LWKKEELTLSQGEILNEAAKRENPKSAYEGKFFFGARNKLERRLRKTQAGITSQNLLGGKHVERLPIGPTKRNEGTIRAHRGLLSV